MHVFAATLIQQTGFIESLPKFVGSIVSLAGFVHAQRVWKARQ
jgi:hypothetical protein